MPAEHYWVCGIRDVPEAEVSDSDADFLAVPGLQRGSIVAEVADGAAPIVLWATAVSVVGLGSNKAIIKLPDKKVKVTFTDSRITLACSKYDTGGRWIGGVSALALDAGERVVAAVRRRGKMFVGQIRYPWVSAVYAQNKQGWKQDSKLCVLVKKRTGEQLLLVMNLPKSTDVHALGAELVRRTATFNLEHDHGIPDEHRDRVSDLRSFTTFDEPESGNLCTLSFPYVKFVSEPSTRLGRSASPDVAQPEPAAPTGAAPPESSPSAAPPAAIVDRCRLLHPHRFGRRRLRSRRPCRWGRLRRPRRRRLHHLSAVDGSSRSGAGSSWAATR